MAITVYFHARTMEIFGSRPFYSRVVVRSSILTNYRIGSVAIPIFNLTTNVWRISGMSRPRFENIIELSIIYS